MTVSGIIGNVILVVGIATWLFGARVVLREAKNRLGLTVMLIPQPSKLSRAEIGKLVGLLGFMFACYVVSDLLGGVLS